MADHFFSINRGKDGFKPTDVRRGTSATTGDDIELRVADAANLTRKDVVVALNAFMRVFETGKSVNLGGTDFPKL